MSAAHGADLVVKAPQPAVASAWDWTGSYIGGNIGVSWGTSTWSAQSAGVPGSVASGSFPLYQPPDMFTEGGSWQIGVQTGSNYMLHNRVVLGIEADASFPSFPNPAGLTTGGSAIYASAATGVMKLTENMLSSGTVRARLGYAPANWLFYVTGGFAWSWNEQILGQGFDADPSASHRFFRLGWAAGVGAEVPVLPQWTARVEYLWTDCSSKTVAWPAFGQSITSTFPQQQLRIGLNYQFEDPSRPRIVDPALQRNEDVFAIHGQVTFTEMAHPAFRSPYVGEHSLPPQAEGRETFDATLSLGFKLWQGAEAWINPEIDQGFGFGNTHGVAGFPTAESYKGGSINPYARVQRAFIRQTINLGGETEKVDADFTQFAGSRTTDRLVFTVGRFGIVDIFDTNKYANNPKLDFLNWTIINAGSFDYGGDGWGSTYGAAGEWYKDSWTFRAGIFDLSVTPAGGESPLGYALDPTFQNFQLVGEIEKRYELWGQPGKIKVTGFLQRGRMGSFADANALAAVTGQPANINAVRQYTSRLGVSANLEQQLTETVGFFARAGWSDGTKEPWDFTDVDHTVSAGFSINGRGWGRPDDTIGIAGVVNGISPVHAAFFNAGGLGILIGDGKLPVYRTENIFETYYSYAVTPATRLTFDYQFIGNPAYNAQRGPVNTFAGRFHWQF